VSPPPGQAAGSAVAALVAEAARKSRICWVSYPHASTEVREQMVWHVWHDHAVVVLGGEEGQLLQGIEGADSVEVTLRSKDTGGRLVTWSARPQVVTAESDRWEEHARALLGVRLNLPDPAAALERWRHSATIVRLAPAQEAVGDGSGPLP
jgi:hypothetical protein